MRHGGPQFVGHRNGIKAGGASGADAASFCLQHVSLGRGQKSDAMLQRNGNILRKGIDRHRKGKIGQGKNRAALGPG